MKTPTPPHEHLCTLRVIVSHAQECQQWPVHTHTCIHNNHTLCCSYQLPNTHMWSEICSADSCFYTANAVTLVKETSHSAAQSACQRHLLQGGRGDEVLAALSPALRGGGGRPRLSGQYCKIGVWKLQGNARHVRHKQVNCCQSSFESCSRRRQLRRVKHFSVQLVGSACRVNSATHPEEEALCLLWPRLRATWSRETTQRRTP